MDNLPVVLDNGSGSIKIGLAGDELPRANFPTIVGRNTGSQETHVNFLNLSTPEAYSKFKHDISSNEIQLNYPVQRGIIKDWDDMEKIWSHAFTSEMHIDIKDHHLLITEPTFNPTSNREKMAQILFETFNVLALSIAKSAVLPLYSAGRTSGIVLECGEGVTQACPVWSGYSLPDAIQRLDLAGQDINEYLSILQREEGYKSPNQEITRIIKDKLCYVALDFQAESSQPSDPTTFELPDGESVTIKESRFRSPELLFEPTLNHDTDSGGVHEILKKSIMKAEIDIRKELYSNIILSGGSTLFQGFAERVQKEMSLISTYSNVIAKPERKFGAWIGGSILASMSTFNDTLITKREYEESGPAVVRKFK